MVSSRIVSQQSKLVNAASARRMARWGAALALVALAAPAIAQNVGIDAAGWSVAGTASAASVDQWVCVFGSGSPLVDGCRCVPEPGQFYCWSPPPKVVEILL